MTLETISKLKTQDFGGLWQMLPIKGDGHVGQLATIKGVIKSSFLRYIYKLIKGIISAKAHGIGHKARSLQTTKTTTTSPLNDLKSYILLTRK